MRDSAFWADKSDPLAMKHGRQKCDELNQLITAFLILTWRTNVKPSEAHSEIINAHVDPKGEWLEEYSAKVRDLNMQYMADAAALIAEETALRNNLKACLDSLMIEQHVTPSELQAAFDELQIDQFNSRKGLSA
jgi:hypothetical protein